MDTQNSTLPEPTAEDRARGRFRLPARRCSGCDNPSPHTHHLTWLGRRLYT